MKTKGEWPILHKIKVAGSATAYSWSQFWAYGLEQKAKGFRWFRWRTKFNYLSSGETKGEVES